MKKQLFFDMLRIRMVEEAIAQRYSEQQMRCPVHLSIGQEAVAVGVCAALERKDYVMSTHRAHAHYLAKGGDLRALLAEIHGKRNGCSSGKGGSMHIVDMEAGMMGSSPIVGSTIPVAVGTAFGSALKNENRITAVFFGEGATEEGVFLESLNFAALKRLPIIFVCENNLYSVYSPLEVRQAPGRDRVALAAAHGILSAATDGNDVQSVYEVAADAATKVRKGEGPAYLEFWTYRWREHCGPNYDNDIGYRTESEFLQWKKRCPIESCRTALLQDGTVSEREIVLSMKAIAAEIEEAFRYARETPFPEMSELFTDVYSNELTI